MSNDEDYVQKITELLKPLLSFNQRTVHDKILKEVNELSEVKETYRAKYDRELSAKEELIKQSLESSKKKDDLIRNLQLNLSSRDDEVKTIKKLLEEEKEKVNNVIVKSDKKLNENNSKLVESRERVKELREELSANEGELKSLKDLLKKLQGGELQTEMMDPAQFKEMMDRM